MEKHSLSYDRIKRILHEQISPLWGYGVVALVPLVIVSFVGYRYLNDTPAHRAATYKEMQRECGGTVIIYTNVRPLVPFGWDKALAPGQPGYGDALHDALTRPHSSYEFSCSGPPEIF